MKEYAALNANNGKISRGSSGGKVDPRKIPQFQQYLAQTGQTYSEWKAKQERRKNPIFQELELRKRALSLRYGNKKRSHTGLRKNQRY